MEPKIIGQTGLRKYIEAVVEATPPATKLLIKSLTIALPFTIIENAVPTVQEAAIEYQIENGVTDKASAKPVFSTPSSGSSTMIGKTVNKTNAPKKDIEIEVASPRYFK